VSWRSDQWNLKKANTKIPISTCSCTSSISREDTAMKSMPGSIGLSTRDEPEVAGYAGVMEPIFSSWPDIALTENHIRQSHRDLLAWSEKDARHRGNYKTSINSVVAFDADGKRLGVVFETATPFDTPRLMTELVAWINDECAAARLHPLLLIGIWVVVFLEIHPFQDGNGRLSWALTTLFLLQAGYAYVPYSSLESVIEQSKEAYYLALRQTQGTIRTDSPDWQPWLVFFLRALAEQVRRLNRKVEREKIVLAALPGLSLQIVEFVREHGRVTMGDAIRLTGGNRNTLKQHFRALVEQGHLGPHGARPGRLVRVAIDLPLGGLPAFQFLADNLADRRLDVGLVKRGLQGLIDQCLIPAITGHVLEPFHKRCIKVERDALLG